jgi:hypothetical protein
VKKNVKKDPVAIFLIPCSPFIFIYFQNMLTDINNVPIDQAIKENGFVIVDNLIPEELFSKLREACNRVVDRARKHDWPHRYVILPNVTF